MSVTWKNAVFLQEVVLDAKRNYAYVSRKLKSAGHLPGVYKHFLDDVLTYIGCSGRSVADRQVAVVGSFLDPSRHESHGPKYKEILLKKKSGKGVLRVEFVPMPGYNKDEIHAFEQKLIKKHKPLLNSHHN